MACSGIIAGVVTQMLHNMAYKLGAALEEDDRIQAKSNVMLSISAIRLVGVKRALSLNGLGQQCICMLLSKVFGVPAVFGFSGKVICCMPRVVA